MFLGLKCGRCVGLTALPPSVSRLTREYGTINISQSSRPPRAVRSIALHFFTSCRFRNAGKLKLNPYLNNEVRHHEKYGEGGGGKYKINILDLSTGWR
jgi:hypothetical protein